MTQMIQNLVGSLPSGAANTVLTFTDGVKIETQALVQKVRQFDYLSSSTARYLAGCPVQDAVLFNGYYYLPFFGGAVVAVESNGQITYLPVMDENNSPLALEDIQAVNVQTSLSRCHVKSIAMNNGVGMSLYAGKSGNALEFLRELEVKPTTANLATVAPLTKRLPGGAHYVHWSSAVTAAKLTDPEFRWSVAFHEHVDEDGLVQKLPYLHVNDSYAVELHITYRGRMHTELYLLMEGPDTDLTCENMADGRRGREPMVNPTVSDWNRTIMRALTRGIARLTGYGLSVYAGHDLDILIASSVVPRLNAKAVNDDTLEAGETEEEMASA